MTKQQIQETITYSLNEYCKEKDISLIIENVSYDFDTINTFIEAYFLSASSDNYTQNGTEELSGIVQVNVNIKKNTGTYIVNEIIEDLKRIFKARGILVNDRGRVHIVRTYESNGGSNNSSAYYRKIFNIEYKEFYYV